MSYALLIIDPQNDFHEGGNLAVMGAKADSERIIDLITAKPPAAIYVSLDTHTPTHIGHQGFWTPEPPFGTVFRVEGGKIMGKAPDGTDAVYNPVDADKYQGLRDWVVEYVTTLTDPATKANKLANNTYKGDPLIWPTHCIEDTEGHEVYGPLMTALNAASAAGIPVHYFIKGQNEAAEMYSIFKAEMPAPMPLYRGVKGIKDGGEVPVTDSKVNVDHANLKTDFNQELFDKLRAEGKPIVVCGEALSHCVNWSTRDLNEAMKALPAAEQLPISLLENASSMVVLPWAPELFIPQTQSFLQYCRDNGVTLTTTEAFAAMAGGRRRRGRRSTRRHRSNKRRSMRRRR